MPWPANYERRTVHGQWAKFPDGSDAQGTVTFTPSIGRLVSASTQQVILAKPISVAISGGEITVDLPVTDDPDVSPTGWTYKVAEKFKSGRTTTYSIQVPRGSDPIELATVSPVQPVTEVTSLLSQADGDSRYINTSGDTVTGPLLMRSTSDATSRVTVESYQYATAESGHDGEGLRLDLMADTAKNMVAWRDVFTDPANPRSVTWVGAHYKLADGSVHQHFSIEVSDTAGLLQTRLEIPYDRDHTNIKTASADLSVDTSSNGVLRLGGPNGVFKDVEFSLDDDGPASARRWTVRVDNATEDGTGDGSDFRILRRDDTGSVAGVPLFIKRSNGLVGIGTASPTDELHVNGNTRVEGETRMYSGARVENGDLTFPDAAEGVILTDRTTGSPYRLYVQDGALAVEPA